VNGGHTNAECGTRSAESFSVSSAAFGSKPALPTNEHPAATREMLTVAQAAAALGFAPETIRKYAEDLGACRLGKRGPLRIPRGKVEFFLANPKLLHQPRAALQELHESVRRVNLLSGERERRMELKLAQFEKRLALLESGRLEKAA